MGSISFFAILKPSRVGEGSAQPRPRCTALRLALSWSRIKPQLSSSVRGQKLLRSSESALQATGWAFFRLLSHFSSMLPSLSV